MINTHNSRKLLFCAILLFFAYSLATAQPPDGGRQRGQGGGGMLPGGGQFTPGQRGGGQFGQGGGGQFTPGQRPGGGQFGQGGGGGQFTPGQRPGGPPAQPAEGNQEEGLVTGPGTVPEIWNVNPQQELVVRPLGDRATITKPLTSKVIRYAEHIILKYDTDMNGQLEYEEWMELDIETKKWHSKIPNGQVIDVNGDGVITLEELASYIERFSQYRTIHNPYPLQQLLANRVIPEQKRPEGIFRPLSQPTAARKILETQNIEERPLLSEDELTATAEDDDDESGDENATLEGRVPASQVRKYAAPTQGLPAWFIQRDLNGDGQVSLYEFAAPGFRDEDLAMFGRLDRNGDGFITPDELPKANAE